MFEMAQGGCSWCTCFLSDDAELSAKARCVTPPGQLNSTQGGHSINKVMSLAMVIFKQSLTGTLSLQVAHHVT
jgi:hypothetical protein